MVDDDEILLGIMYDILSVSGFTIKSFSDPHLALNYLKTHKNYILFTDLNMPEMEGDELIRKVLKAFPEAIITIISSSQDAERAVELINEGIYDYLVKPVNPKTLLSHTRRAIEIHEFRQNKNLDSALKKIEIDNEIKWNVWKDNIVRNSLNRDRIDIIGNLNSGLVQGSGIGSIVSITTLIKATSELKDDHFIIHKDIMNLLFESSEIASRTINVLNEIEHLTKDEIEKKTFLITEIGELIQFQADHYSFIATSRNQKIHVAKNLSLNARASVELNLEYFLKVVDELLINALKFSLENSNIYVLFEIDDSVMKIIFLNSPELNKEEIQKLQTNINSTLFDPFIRFSNLSYSRYRTLDLGLGLTIVDKIMKNHKGNIHIGVIKNYLDSGISENLISVTIEFQLKK